MEVCGCDELGVKYKTLTPKSQTIIGQMELFEMTHGVPLTIGLKVKVSSDFERDNGDDWSGVFYVTGIAFDRYNKINITLSENMDAPNDAYDEFGIGDVRVCR